jgi:hypothetical protein
MVRQEAEDPLRKRCMNEKASALMRDAVMLCLWHCGRSAPLPHSIPDKLKQTYKVDGGGYDGPTKAQSGKLPG